MVAGDSDGGNFILTVLNFTRSDDGEVSCEVTGAQAVSSRFEAIGNKYRCRLKRENFIELLLYFSNDGKIKYFY